MQAYIGRGLAVAFVAFTVVGLAACAESLAPSRESRAARSSPAFSVSGSIDGGTVMCTPCPPGMVCAAVCNPSPPIEVAPPVAGDTAGTDATILFSRTAVRN